MGYPPMQDRLAWYAASPIAYATFGNNSTAFLLVWGTEDDIAEPSIQSEPFLLALKQARFHVRTVVVPFAPHSGWPIRWRKWAVSRASWRRGCCGFWRSGFSR
jgi:acetyl esterase/lipase